MHLPFTRSSRVFVGFLWGLFAWGALAHTSEARFLHRSDISLWQMNRTWKEVRQLLAKARHPKDRTLLRLWKQMSKPSQPIVPFAPKGFFIPEWFADARRGSIWLNVTYIKSLRRQFNNALYYHRKAIDRFRWVDVLGAAWGEIWGALALQQHRRKKLRLLFAMKLLPGFEYARCRAHLQGILRRRHGVVFSVETAEVALICLHHKRRVYRSIMRHPILRRLWKLLVWKLSDRSLERLSGERPVFLHMPYTPAWRAACSSGELLWLVSSLHLAFRRENCSFCPAYSLRETHTRIHISLVKGGHSFQIDTERYRSLIFGRPGELLNLIRNQWLYHSTYTNAFLRRIRAKGPLFLSRRASFERNLMVDQVRQYNGLLREHIRGLLRPWTVRTISNFYRRILRQRVKVKRQQLASCIKATEEQWLRLYTPHLYEWLPH